MNRFAAGQLAVATILAAACFEQPPDEERRPARPWASNDTWIDAELAAESDDALHLSRVEDLAVDSRGRVYVRDGLRRDVLVLDSMLDLLATIGRDGEGPGEFKWVGHLQVLPGDSLLVFDGQLDRLTVFAEHYDTSRSTVVPDVSGLWRMRGPRAGYLAMDREAFYAGEDAAADEERYDVYSILDESAQSYALDSVLTVPSSETLIMRGRGVVSIRDHPYGREGLVGMLAAGGFAYASSGALSVSVVGPEGQPLHSFAYPLAPLAVSRADLQAEIDKDSVFADVLVAGAPYTWPPLVGLETDDRDRIWLGLRSSRTEWEWAAFTPDGGHVGSVSLPAGLRVIAVSEGKLFGVLKDDLDVPRIRVYDIREASLVPAPPLDRARSWAAGPWLKLDPRGTRTATGYGLGDFDGIALDSQGRVHVVDQSSKELVVFDSELRFSRAVPPAPIDRSVRIDVLARDSIVALDWRTGLASVRSTMTGQASSQFIVSGAGTYYPYAIWALGRGTGFLAAYTSSYTPDNALRKDRRNFVRLLDRDGGVVRDSILLFPSSEKLVVETERGLSVGPHPFGVVSYVRVLAGTTIVQAASDEFAVNLVDPEGDAVTSFSYPADSIWVSDAELAAVAANESEGRAAALLAKERHARPMLVGLAVDNARRTIWVGVWSPASSQEWAAFDTTGAHLASVALPASFNLHGVWRDRLVGIDFSQGKHAPVLQSYQLLREDEP